MEFVTTNTVPQVIPGTQFTYDISGQVGIILMWEIISDADIDLVVNGVVHFSFRHRKYPTNFNGAIPIYANGESIKVHMEASSYKGLPRRVELRQWFAQELN